MTRSFKYFLTGGLSVLLVLPVCFAEEEAVEKKQEVRVISLEDAQKRVLSSDQSIRNAYLEIKKAELLPWSAWTKYTPRLTGDGSYNNTPANSIGGGSGRSDNLSAGITYQQPIFDFSFFSTYELGKLSAEISKLDKKFLERDVILGLVKAYYDVLKQKKLVALDHEILDLTEKQLNFAQERLKVGDVTSVDVARAQLDVENAKNQLVADEASLALSRTTLASILNLDERKIFEVEEPPVEEMQEEEYDLALQRAYRQREDYTAVALAIDQSQEKKNQVISEYVPTVTGQLSQEWTKSSGQASETPWSGGVSVSVPFFEGGQRELDLKNADYEIEQSRIARETLSKSIEVEVRTAWLQVRTLQQKLSNLTIAAETADQIYRQTQAQYEAGVSTSLDVLVSLRDLNQTKTNFVTAQYDYLVALRTLKRATADLGREKGSS